MNIQESFRIIHAMKDAYERGEGKAAINGIFREEIKTILAGEPFCAKAMCIEILADIIMDPEEGELKKEGEINTDLSYLNATRNELFTLLSLFA